MNTKTFNMTMPKKLVALIDQEAQVRFMSRSEYIRRCVLKQLKKDGALATSNDSVEGVVRRERITRLKKAALEMSKNQTEDLR